MSLRLRNCRRHETFSVFANTVTLLYVKLLELNGIIINLETPLDQNTCLEHTKPSYLQYTTASFQPRLVTTAKHALFILRDSPRYQNDVFEHFQRKSINLLAVCPISYNNAEKQKKLSKYLKKELSSLQST